MTLRRAKGCRPASRWDQAVNASPGILAISPLTPATPYRSRPPSPQAEARVPGIGVFFNAKQLIVFGDRARGPQRADLDLSGGTSDREVRHENVLGFPGARG